MVAAVALAGMQTPAGLTPKKFGATGLTMSLPAVELKPSADSTEKVQNYSFSAQGIDFIVTYREAPAGVLADIEFAARAAADQLPGAVDIKPTLRPVGVSGLQARRFSRGPLAAGLFVQAGEKSWRVLTRIKDAAAAKTRDAILDSASVDLTPPSGWRTQPLKDSKVTASLPTAPDIAFGSVPNAFRMVTFTSITQETIITITEIETVKGAGPSLAEQLQGIDADLKIPTEADVFRKAVQPLKVSGVDGYRIDYEFRYAGSSGVFSAMLLVRGDQTWRLLVARKKADADGANIADWVLNSIRIAK